MAASETARLLAELTLKDNFTKTIGKAKAETTALGAAMNSTTPRLTSVTRALEGGFGRVGKAVSAGRNALSHFGGAITGLLGPLGIVGLTGASLGLGVAIEHSISKASDMAFAVEKLTGLTGASAESMSGLLVLFEKFGVDADKTSQIVGFTEKTLGKMNDTLTKGGVVTSKLALIQSTYGVKLTDARGRALGFAEVLNKVSDFYNSNASAADKAQLAATVFGRGYAALIPVLKLGSKGIADAEAASKDLGLTLTKDNIQQLKEFRTATREAGEAVGGLQLQIGLAAIPTIKELADAITRFLKNGGRQQLVEFFKQSVDAARGFAGFFGNTVIPTIQGLVGAAKTFIDAIPAPLREILLKGFVADRTIKFLFGFSPIKIVTEFAAGAISRGLGGVLGSFLGRGGSPATPMFVADVTGKGGLGAAAGGATLLGKLGSIITKLGGLALAFGGTQLIGAGVNAGGPTGAALGAGGAAATIGGGALIAGPLGAIAGAIVSVGITLKGIRDNSAAQGNTIADSIKNQIAGGAKLSDLRTSLSAVDQGINDIQANPLNVLLAGDALDQLRAQHDLLVKQIAEQSRTGDAVTAFGKNANAILDRGGRETGGPKTSTIGGAISAAIAVGVNAVRHGFSNMITALKESRSNKAIQAAVKEAIHQVVELKKGSVNATKETAAQLKAALKRTHDPQTEKEIRAALAKVQAKIPGREYAIRQIAKADRLIADGHLTKAEISKVKAIENDLKNRGLPHAAAVIQAKVNEKGNQTTAAVDRTTAAVKAQQVAFTIQNAVSVSLASLLHGQKQYNSWTRTDSRT